MSVFKKIQRLVKKIPPGKVTTYGEIAKALGIKNSRLVGWAMHGNKNRSVPCHRVVFKDGSLAPGYTFGGPKVQKEKLIREGIKFNDKNLVNLKTSFWNPK
jgi:methylated-DNA-protein-cysteine methyltransferase-like protein